MTTEPFSPPSGTDPASGTATISPVTTEMMDHAARAAAQRADAVAHEASETPSAAHSGPPAQGEPDAPQVEPPSRSPEISEAADENAAATLGAPATGASQPLPTAANLAFSHGGHASERTVDRPSRAAAASFDDLGPFNAKVLEIAAANMAAAGDFMSSLLAARTVNEAAAVNVQYMRRTFDALTSQGRELMTLGQKTIFDAARSSGVGFHKR